MENIFKARETTCSPKLAFIYTSRGNRYLAHSPWPYSYVRTVYAGRSHNSPSGQGRSQALGVRSKHLVRLLGFDSLEVI